MNAVVSAFHMAGEVFADETVEQGAEYVLLEVPAVNGATDFIGDLPDLALQLVALFSASHEICLVFPFVFFVIPSKSVMYPDYAGFSKSCGFVYTGFWFGIFLCCFGQLSILTDFCIEYC